MSSNSSEILGRKTGISSVNSTAQKVGWGIFGIGALYMLLMGWLSSWWVVPTIRQTGWRAFPEQPSFSSGNWLLL